MIGASGKKAKVEVPGFWQKEEVRLVAGATAARGESNDRVILGIKPKQ